MTCFCRTLVWQSVLSKGRSGIYPTGALNLNVEVSQNMSCSHVSLFVGSSQISQQKQGSDFCGVQAGPIVQVVCYVCERATMDCAFERGRVRSII